MTVKVVFKGVVQGVGFRPSAQRLALEYNIGGQIKNSGGSVELIISAEPQTLDKYIRRLVSAFEIKSYEKTVTEDRRFDGFEIVSSSADGGAPFISPDRAVCAECERELRDPLNRRYRHPFISCVNCGPRYSVINALPYDRENITLSVFEMCEKCEEEYTNPQDRRCHAQTIACRECGPVTSMSVEDAAQLLKDGGVLAVKDTGGYHLACRADIPQSVNKIRELKHREKKPFAVMFSCIEEIEEYCFVGEKEKELLLSPVRPIVLLEARKGFDTSVCGGSSLTGAFLPGNPIQIMLLDEVSPLVMTSANISSRPIITDDEEIKELGVPVLSHNREIACAVDDSVVKVTAGRAQTVRRAAGYVPLAIEIDRSAREDTLCLGGDLKSVFAFHSGKYVYLSQPFGDLEDADVLSRYKENIKRFAALHSFGIDKTVCDAHPTYISSRLFGGERVQHHRAHIASVIAEHRLGGSVLGFAFDGTGYGDDGAIWGSEVFLYDGKTFERKEHLQYVKMPTSDEISRDARLALSCYLGGNELIDSAVRTGTGVVNSSSMGRLFDAVSALLCVCSYNTYEGECACALEELAKKAKKEYHIDVTLNPVDILMQLSDSSAPASERALGFHMMLCRLIVSLSEKYYKSCGVRQIALSGGTFNNKIITENTIRLLEDRGFDVYINELVPCGDGGLALGQAYIAASEK